MPWTDHNTTVVGSFQCLVTKSRGPRSRPEALCGRHLWFKTASTTRRVLPGVQVSSERAIAPYRAIRCGLHGTSRHGSGDGHPSGGWAPGGTVGARTGPKSGPAHQHTACVPGREIMFSFIRCGWCPSARLPLRLEARAGSLIDDKVPPNARVWFGQLRVFIAREARLLCAFMRPEDVGGSEVDWDDSIKRHGPSLTPNGRTGDGASSAGPGEPATPSGKYSHSAEEEFSVRLRRLLRSCDPMAASCLAHCLHVQESLA